jgi:hypothetical protein
MAQGLKRGCNYQGAKVGRKWTPKVHKKCEFCGESMVTTGYKILSGRGKYCSKPCASSAKVGLPSEKRKGETRNCLHCGKEFYATPAQVKNGNGKYCSRTCDGARRVGTLHPWNKGKTCPSIAGANNPAWKGGTASEYELIKGSREYKLWRKAVYARDFYTCQSCGAKPDRKAGIKIHAHHILSFAEFPHKRTDISNGVTLCESCHWKAHGRKEKQQ